MRRRRAVGPTRRRVRLWHRRRCRPPAAATAPTRGSRTGGTGTRRPEERGRTRRSEPVATGFPNGVRSRGGSGPTPRRRTRRRRIAAPRPTCDAPPTTAPLRRRPSPTAGDRAARPPASAGHRPPPADPRSALPGAPAPPAPGRTPPVGESGSTAPDRHSRGGRGCHDRGARSVRGSPREDEAGSDARSGRSGRTPTSAPRVWRGHRGRRWPRPRSSARGRRRHRGASLIAVALVAALGGGRCSLPGTPSPRGRRGPEPVGRASRSAGGGAARGTVRRSRGGTPVTGSRWHVPEMLDRTLVRNYSHVLVRRSVSHLVGTVHPRSGGQHPRWGQPIVIRFPHRSAGHRRTPTKDDRHGSGTREGTRDGPRSDREAVRQGLRHEDGREDLDGCRVDRHRGALARHRTRDRRPSAWPSGRDLRPGVLGQVHPGHARGGRGAAQRRHLRLCRCGARDGSHLRRPHRRGRRRAARSPSPTPASRRSRSPTCWCAPVRSTSS